MVPYQMLKRKGWKELLSCLVATAGLVGLSLVLKSNPGQGSTHMSMLFLSGAISISAMILPGISGSFILLLLGEYKTILEAINHWELPKLTVFALGCLLGIIAFVKLLQFLLKRFHSVTMAFLIGLILGSLWILWPFKTVPAGAKIIQGSNILPPGFNPEVWWSLGALVVGLICSMGLTYLGKLREEKTEPEATSTT